MLCQQCEKILARPLNSLPGSWDGIKPELFEYPQSPNTWTGAHHTEPKQFLAAVSQRCYVDSTIFRDLSPPLRDQAHLFRTFYQLRLLPPDDAQQNPQDRYELDFTVEFLQGQDPLPRRQAFGCTGTFKVLPKSEITVQQEALDLTENTFSGKCKDQVQQWLINCERSHQRCNRDWRTKGSYPTRLLQITQNDLFTLKTVSDSTDFPKYVTLSHCWDEEMPVKLTIDTEENLKRGLSITELPPKFKDAMEIAVWMDVKHIWIDALCILQDDEDDWFEESSRMGDIYAGSYCNIAATKWGMREGCFTSRNTKMVEPYSISNPRSKDAETTHVIGYDDFWSNSLLDTRLNNRCWVLQERLLSPRTIHFGQEQIFWECRCEMACEAYPNGIPNQFRNHKTRAWRRSDKILDPDFKQEEILPPSPPPRTFWQTIAESFSKLMSHGNPSLTVVAPTEVYGIWSKIIERYMECELSFGKDKLVAISGIAQKVAAATNERYLAGLWENNLMPQSLLWFVLARTQADNTASWRSPSAGDAGYRAPSWSWASVDAKVIWNWTATCDKVLIKILATDIEERKGSKMGAILSASMKVEGCLRKCSLRIMNKRTDGTPEEDGRYGLQLSEEPSEKAGPEPTSIGQAMIEPAIYLDTPLMPKASRITTYLLPVCTEWKGRSGNITTKMAGLLLRRCPTSEKMYERIGIFGLDQKQVESLYSVRLSRFNHIEGVLASGKTIISLV